jgi:hypothetical protein
MMHIENGIKCCHWHVLHVAKTLTQDAAADKSLR